MAYRKKAGLIVKRKPDIVIVPECEHPDKMRSESHVPIPNDVFWFDNNPNKGLGVFSYRDYKLQLDGGHNSDFRTILPLTVRNKKSTFSVFAIWANNPSDRGYQYVGQIWKAINFYSDRLNNKKTILVGDFNSNTMWDKPKREGNHSTVVEFLASKGIHSTYHHFFDQNHGKEKHNTLFMYRHRDKFYHIDYCFASNDLVKKLTHVEVGKHTRWCKHSDHTPLIVTFDI